MIQEFALKSALQKAKEVLAAYLANERSFSEVRELLRSNYENAVRPAQYDYVAEHLRLTNSDIRDIVSNLKSPTPTALKDSIIAVLTVKVGGWVENRPPDDVVRTIVSDFSATYIARLEQTDPAFNILLNTKYTATIIDRLEAFIPKPNHAADTLADQVIVFVTTLNLPFTVVSRTPHSCNLTIVDTGARWVHKLFISVHNAPTHPEEVAHARDLAKADLEIGTRFLVSADVNARNTELQSLVPGFKLVAPYDFFQSFTQTDAPNGFEMYSGSACSAILRQRLNIRDIFIEPDAVETRPGDNMGTKFYSERQPALLHIRRFLKSDSNLLVLLGNYGSGKSALCSVLLDWVQDFTTVLVPLRSLRDSDEVSKVVLRAHRLAKRLGGDGKPSLVILDGIDEMRSAMDPQQRKYNLSALLQSSQLADKLIVTARTSYFRGLEQFWTLFERKDDTVLWTQVSSSILPSGIKTKVEAIVLREFDTDAISKYIGRYGQITGESVTYDRFVASLAEIEECTQVLLLMRSPLYLYLILRLKPWRNAGVKCLNEMVETFIAYWLARDTEKGPSRWGLSENDRRDFAAKLAVHLHNRKVKRITFNEFVRFATSHLEEIAQPELRARFVLDLQTTGIFSCIGDELSFAVPLFADHFVAKEFSLWRTDMRLITLDQCKLALGAFETDPAYAIDSKKEDRSIQYFDCDETRRRLASHGVEFENITASRLHLQRRRYVFQQTSDKWERLNHPNFLLFRCILYHHLSNTCNDANYLEVFVATRHGLHARTSARLVAALSRIPSQPDSGSIQLSLERDDERASALSIQDVMMLAAGTGSVLRLCFTGCSRAAVEEALQAAGSRFELETGRWIFHANERNQYTN